VKKLLFIMIVSMLPLTHAIADTKTVGNVMAPRGIVVVFVTSADGDKEVVLSVSDLHSINRVFIELTPKNLEKLSNLLEAAKVEYNKD
jgi:hypothetical protein